MKIALYLRTATKNKDQLKQQRNQLKQFCKTHHYEVVEEFVDFGVSGNTIDRPGLKALLNSGLEETPWSAVVMTDRSRLSRDFENYHDLKENLECMGSKVLFAHDYAGSLEEFNTYWVRQIFELCYNYLDLGAVAHTAGE